MMTEPSLVVLDSNPNNVMGRSSRRTEISMKEVYDRGVTRKILCPDRCLCLHITQ